jgi:hypothetical protein
MLTVVIKFIKNDKDTELEYKIGFEISKECEFLVEYIDIVKVTDWKGYE